MIPLQYLFSAPKDSVPELTEKKETKMGFAQIVKEMMLLETGVRNLMKFITISFFIFFRKRFLSGKRMEFLQGKLF